jgi:hypothetical protein
MLRPNDMIWSDACAVGARPGARACERVRACACVRACRQCPGPRFAHARPPTKMCKTLGDPYTERIETCVRARAGRKEDTRLTSRKSSRYYRDAR